MTAAQVIIWVVSAIAALGSALLLVLGVVGLVSGASVAASAAGTESSGLGTAFGGLIGFFSGGLIVIAVISLAFVGLWFWIASALGRGSRPARIVATVFCGIDLAFGLIALVGSLADRDGAPVLGGLLGLVIPAVLMALLWGAESSRRFFDGAPAVPTQGGPAPMSPPAGFGRPQWGQQPWGQQQGTQQRWGQQWGPQQWGPQSGPQQYRAQQPYDHPQVAQVPEGVTAPIKLPSQRCGTCQAEVRPGSPSCSGCGAPMTPPRPVGA
ncbi:hypothetical protein [Actinomycetospora sp. TBRC 11914]|uniref:hypothetical protein n=1 Tax=Actinomycetospora sp. TBRC 11914 TaxID=2729387 RepID=UPI00145E12F7|nr:hypothetical protein [Actinomycetospora sp. TBRC 11914]NMO90379.1 hypothetical protein [Actinomycetospora sp. TBRC 11914]